MSELHKVDTAQVVYAYFYLCQRTLTYSGLKKERLTFQRRHLFASMVSDGKINTTLRWLKMELGPVFHYHSLVLK